MSILPLLISSKHSKHGQATYREDNRDLDTNQVAGGEHGEIPVIGQRGVLGTI
jgi:hypothetical protein